MPTLVVLFNLKSGVAVCDYEAWAQSTDLPIVRNLASIDSFSVFRNVALLGDVSSPPFAYTEIIQVSDMDQFGRDTATVAMQKIAAEFQTFADSPVFMLSQCIEGA
jgi:REDY-like protein HapK